MSHGTLFIHGDERLTSLEECRYDGFDKLTGRINPVFRATKRTQIGIWRSRILHCTQRGAACIRRALQLPFCQTALPSSHLRTRTTCAFGSSIMVSGIESINTTFKHTHNHATILLTFTSMYILTLFDTTGAINSSSST